VKLDRAAGALVDELGDLVPVAVAVFEEREDEHFGAAFPQVSFRHI